MGTTDHRFWTHAQAVAVRLVMIVMAIGIVITAAALITTPWAIPLVIGLWLGALAIAALGLVGKLPDEH